MADSLPWNKPNGLCAQCGAPLNEFCVGGYKVHDGTFAVAAELNPTLKRDMELLLEELWKIGCVNSDVNATQINSISKRWLRKPWGRMEWNNA